MDKKIDQNKNPLISEDDPKFESECDKELDTELEFVFDMCFGCWRYFRCRK